MVIFKGERGGKIGTKIEICSGENFSNLYVVCYSTPICMFLTYQSFFPILEICEKNMKIPSIQHCMFRLFLQICTSSSPIFGLIFKLFFFVNLLIKSCVAKISFPWFMSNESYREETWGWLKPFKDGKVCRFSLW